ncbi:MAG: hypothetical protein QXF61_05630 [Nitrososphaeria archaeon]
MSEIYIITNGTRILRSELLGKEACYLLLKHLYRSGGFKRYEDLEKSLTLTDNPIMLIELLKNAHALEVIGIGPEKKYSLTRSGRRWFTYLRVINTDDIAGHLELKMGMSEIQNTFFNEIKEKAGLLRKIYIVSPFLTDLDFLDKLLETISGSSIRKETLYFVTRPVENVRFERGKHEEFIRKLEDMDISYKLVSDLHAKLFLGAAYERSESFAIVSSLNITPNPIIDVGVLIKGELEEIQDLIDALEESVKKL